MFIRNDKVCTQALVWNLMKELESVTKKLELIEQHINNLEECDDERLELEYSHLYGLESL